MATVRQASQIRLDPELFEKAKVVAAHESRTLNAQFEYWIKTAVAEWEAAHGIIGVTVFPPKP